MSAIFHKCNNCGLMHIYSMRVTVEVYVCTSCGAENEVKERITIDSLKVFFGSFSKLSPAELQGVDRENVA